MRRSSFKCLRSTGGPGHDGDGRDGVLGRAIDQTVANRNIDEGVAGLVDRTEDVGVLEEKGCALGIHLLFVRQLSKIHCDWPDLTARDGEARGIFGQSKCPFEATRPGLTDVASDTRHLWIIECADANFVVGADEAKCRADAAEIFGRYRASRRHQRQPRNGDYAVALHNGSADLLLVPSAALK